MTTSSMTHPHVSSRKTPSFLNRMLTSVLVASVLITPPGTASSSDAPSELNLNILQQNTWLIPVRPFANNPIDKNVPHRAARLGSWLETTIITRQIDIVFLEEVWSASVSCAGFGVGCIVGTKLYGRKRLVKDLLKVFPHVTTPVGAPALSFSTKLFDSGLIIASRFPIIAQEFHMFPQGSAEDKLASKGVLIVGLRLEEGGIVIAACAHMDAGNDDAIKLAQMGQALDWIEAFSKKMMHRHKSEIKATIFTGDFNIDGHRFWEKESTYATALETMSKYGFLDSWHMTSRKIPRLVYDEFTPQFYPQLGLTTHHHECSARLDYIWVKPGDMNIITSAHVSLNHEKEWQTPNELLDQIQNAKRMIDVKKRLMDEIDLANRKDLLSDHAALFAKIVVNSK